MATQVKSKVSPREPSKKESARTNNSTKPSPHSDFEKGKHLFITLPKIEIKQLKLENVQSFTVEEVEKKIHNVDKMRSMEAIKVEVEILEELMITNKGNKKMYEEKKEKLESMVKKMKKGLDSGDVKMERYLESLNKQLSYETCLREELKKNKCPEKEYNRVKDRIKLIQAEITKLETKIKEPVNAEPKKEEERIHKKPKEEEKKRTCFIHP